MVLRATFYAFFAAFVGLATSCATGDYDQIEEQMSQESEQEIQQEEVVQEEMAGDSEISSDQAVGDTQNMQEVMQEPVTGGSSESLASELDKLSTPDVQEESVGDDSMVNVVTDTDDVGGTNVGYTDPASLPEVAEEQSEYIVQPGDTLGHIANVVYGNFSRWTELASDNGLTNPSLIFPGDIVRYRVTDRARNFRDAYGSVEQEVIMVQKGDTLEVIAERLFGRRDYWKPMWHLNRDEIPNPHQIKEGQILKYVDPKKIAKVLSDKGLTGFAH